MNATSTTDIAHSALASKRSAQPAGRTQPLADNDRADFSTMMNILDVTYADTDSGHPPSGALIANAEVSREEYDPKFERTDRAELRCEWNGLLPYQPAVARLPDNVGCREQAFHGELSLIEPNATGSGARQHSIRAGLADPADKPSGSANEPGQIPAAGNNAIATTAAAKPTADSPHQQLRPALSNSLEQIPATGNRAIAAAAAVKPTADSPNQQLRAALSNSTEQIPATGNNAIATAASAKQTADSPNPQLRTAVSNSPDRILAESGSVSTSQAVRPAAGDFQFPRTMSHAAPGTDAHSSAPAVERPLDASTWRIDGPSQMADAAAMPAPKGDVAATRIALAPANARSRELRTISAVMELPLTDARSGNSTQALTDGLAGVAGVLRMGDDRQVERTRAAPTAIYGIPVIHSDALIVTTVPTVPIAPAIANPQWAEALGGAVMRMTAENLGEATLIVSPAELGAISVKIDLDGQQVSVSFLVGNAEVHRAVEAALPRLQEMMAQSGLSLGQSSVSQEQPKSPFQATPPQSAAPVLSTRGTSGISEVGAVLPRRAAAGRVDLFV